MEIPKEHLEALERAREAEKLHESLCKCHKCNDNTAEEILEEYLNAKFKVQIGEFEEEIALGFAKFNTCDYNHIIGTHTRDIYNSYEQEDCEDYYTLFLGRGISIAHTEPEWYHKITKEKYDFLKKLKGGD